MELEKIQRQIAKYEKQYGIDILFTDAQGNIQVGSGDTEKYASFLQKLPEKIIKEDDHDDYAYEKEPESKNYTITKYMKNLTGIWLFTISILMLISIITF